jgi:hypothetical protein
MAAPAGPLAPKRNNLGDADRTFDGPSCGKVGGRAGTQDRVFGRRATGGLRSLADAGRRSPGFLRRTCDYVRSVKRSPRTDVRIYTDGRGTAHIGGKYTRTLPGGRRNENLRLIRRRTASHVTVHGLVFVRSYRTTAHREAERYNEINRLNGVSLSFVAVGSRTGRVMRMTEGGWGPGEEDYATTDRKPMVMITK